MRFEALDRRQAEPIGNGTPLRLIGGEVDPLAIANLVNSKPVSKSIHHEIRPSATAVPGVASSRDQTSRSALEV